MSPRFSVVVPAYQAREFIGETLGRILAQSYPDFEVIVVDNGSTDGTADVVRGFADERVRYIRQENTGSPAGPRNTGISNARGEFVAFCDADDLWSAGKLEHVAGILDADPGLDVVAHGIHVTRDGRVIETRTLQFDPAEDVLEQLAYRGNLLATSATTARRTVLEKADGFSERTDLTTVEDYDLWMRLAAMGCRFALSTEVLTEYVLHGSNASANLVRSYDNQFRALDDALHRLAEDGRLDVRRALARKTRARLALVRDLARQGDVALAAGYALRFPLQTVREYRILGRMSRNA